MKRKRRVGEVTCRCFAYPFAHRMMGGRCDGGAFVGDTYDTQLHGACRGCILLDEDMQCQVIGGLEPSIRCPELQEKVRFEEIRLYGVNANAEFENPKRRRVIRRAKATR